MDGIKVKIFDIKNGLRVYDNIKIIRIISKGVITLANKKIVHYSLDKIDSENANFNIIYLRYD